VDQLNAPAVEQEAGSDEKRVGPLVRKRCERDAEEIERAVTAFAQAAR
jgi:hypothetical protein